jgi:hypothetical protein
MDEAKAKLVSTQKIAVNKNKVLEEKKKAFELAEKEALEAENNVNIIKCKIEAIKVKGQFEETFLRFPHIAEHIFETLDIQSLSKCQEVSKCWQEFVFETKPFFLQLENYTSIPKSILKKSLKNYDFQTIKKLANCASISHKKAVNATIPFQLAEPKGPTLFYYILSEQNLNDTQLLLVKLMVLNKMDKSAELSTFSLANQEGVEYSMAVLEIAIDGSGKFGKAYTSFKNMVITKRGKWGTILSWPGILTFAIAQRHLAVCKLIFKQIQDIHPLHKLGNSVLQQAVLSNHRDMCEFIIDEIQGLNLLAYEDLWGQNLMDMADNLGFKEISTLLEERWTKSLIEKLMHK